MFLLVLALLFAQPQQAPANAAPSSATSVPTVDPKLHSDVVILIQLIGIQKKMDDIFPQSLDDAQPIMQRQCPKCTPEFFVEYKKRMIARHDSTPCVNASIASYEKYLSDKDVLELIALQRAQNDGHPIPPSEEIKAKLTTVLPVMMPEVIGKCSEIGAKLGAEVGAEISKEHPEYSGETPKP